MDFSAWRLPRYCLRTQSIWCALIWRGFYEDVTYFEACCIAHKGRMTKRGVPPPIKRLQKRRHCFSSTAWFSMCMWSLASIQLPSRMCALPRYTILHIFTITSSEQPNAQRPVVQALSSPKSQTYSRTGNISGLCTASVCFTQEEPHRIPSMLNRGGRIQSYCPVATH